MLKLKSKTQIWKANAEKTFWSCCVMCSTYLDRLAEEVNDKLQEAGLISIAELCKNYDLPGDFLTEVSQSTARVHHICVWMTHFTWQSLMTLASTSSSLLWLLFADFADCCMFSDLSQELSKRLGKLIQGEMDQYNRGVLFTPAFVARHKARIRGLFSSITR